MAAEGKLRGDCAGGKDTGGDGAWFVEAATQLPHTKALEVAAMLGKQGDCLLQLGSVAEAAQKYRCSLRVAEAREKDTSARD